MYYQPRGFILLVQTPQVVGLRCSIGRFSIPRRPPRSPLLCVWDLRGHHLFNTSSRFSSKLAIIVHAANSLGFSAASGFVSPTAISFFAFVHVLLIRRQMRLVRFQQPAVSFASGCVPSCA